MGRSIQIPLIDYQSEWLHSTEKIAILQGGAGCGKTWAEALAVHTFSLQFPGVSGMFISESFPQMNKTFIPHWRSLQEQFGLRGKLRYNEQKHEVRMPDGTVYWFGSARNPESLFGPNLGWIVPDELGLWKRYSYDVVLTRLRGTTGPHIIRGGYTPKGRAHWTYHEFKSSRPGLHIVRGRKNPYLAQDYYDTLAREFGTDSAIYRQEALGEFVAFEGLIYPQFSREFHVSSEPLEQDTELPIYLAIDWGVTNPTVVLVLQVDRHGRIRVLREKRYQNMRSSLHAKETVRWLRHEDIWKWPELPFIYSDPAGRDPALEYRAVGFGLRYGAKKVDKGIECVHKGLTYRSQMDPLNPDHKGRPRSCGQSIIVIDPRCERLIAELETYSYQEGSDQPEKVDDHGPDALRYGVSGLWREVAPADWRDVDDEEEEE